MYRSSDVQAVELDVAEVAMINMPPDKYFAFARGRSREENARASHITITGLEIRARNLPVLRHTPPPSKSVRLS
jgi:hypothetical protein